MFSAPLLVGAASALLVARERRRHRKAERLAAALLETLLCAVDANDPDTGAHARRVARYALILCDAAGFDARTRHSVERVALYHDIGKIHQALFDIIHDKTKLSPAERRAIATHPWRGAQVLKALQPFYPDLAEGVLAHHERWDGSGYPHRLRGLRIPLTARVVAIVDTFDAVTHRRRYREGVGGGFGAQVIGEGRGTQFDPELTDLFLCTPVLEEITAAMREHHRPRGVTRERRHEREAAAPDITFRWRTLSSETRPRGRDSTERRG